MLLADMREVEGKVVMVLLLCFSTLGKINVKGTADFRLTI